VVVLEPDADTLVAMGTDLMSARRSCDVVLPAFLAAGRDAAADTALRDLGTERREHATAAL
jgi:hypothetical protein